MSRRPDISLACETHVMDRPTFLYRAYHLRADGHILRAEIVSAGSDDEALAKLDAMTGRHGIELWDRARFVGKTEGSRPEIAADIAYTAAL